MQNIIPSSDLRNRYPEVSRMLKDTHQPIYITVNGRGDSVILDIEAYQKLQFEMELLAGALRGEQDVKDGKTGSLKELFERIDKEFGFKWFTKSFGLKHLGFD